MSVIHVKNTNVRVKSHYRRAAFLVVQWTAFAVETVGVALVYLIILAFLICRSDALVLARELGNFFTHLSTAEASVRNTFAFSASIGFLFLVSIVGFCRFSGGLAAIRLALRRFGR